MDVIQDWKYYFSGNAQIRPLFFNVVIIEKEVEVVYKMFRSYPKGKELEYKTEKTSTYQQAINYLMKDRGGPTDFFIVHRDRIITKGFEKKVLLKGDKCFHDEKCG